MGHMSRGRGKGHQSSSLVGVVVPLRCRAYHSLRGRRRQNPGHLVLNQNHELCIEQLLTGNVLPNMVVRDSAASRNSVVWMALFLSASIGTSVKDFLNVSRRVPSGGIEAAILLGSVCNLELTNKGSWERIRNVDDVMNWTKTRRQGRTGSGQSTRAPQSGPSINTPDASDESRLPHIVQGYGHVGCPSRRTHSLLQCVTRAYNGLLPSH